CHPCALSLHDALPISANLTISADAGTPVNGRKIVFDITCDATPRTITFTGGAAKGFMPVGVGLNVSGSDFTYVLTASKTTIFARSEEHTSELQSRENL